MSVVSAPGARAPRSVLVPFEHLLSELCGFPLAPEEPVLFDRVNAKSACWWLTWGEHMDERGILFGPAYELARLGLGGVVDGRIVSMRVPVEVRLRDAKSDVIAACIRARLRVGAC